MLFWFNELEVKLLLYFGINSQFPCLVAYFNFP